MKSQLHYLSAAHCAAPVTFCSELPRVRTINHRLHPNLPQEEGKSKNKDSIPAFFKKKSVTSTSSNTARTNSRPLGRVREGLTISCFFTANGGLFFTATGRFLNHVGCCRHAKHGVGVGWGRQGGKLVFRLASPPSPKRRSRQQPPWLFVFISSTNRSS